MAEEHTNLPSPPTSSAPGRPESPASRDVSALDRSSRQEPPLPPGTSPLTRDDLQPPPTYEAATSSNPGSEAKTAPPPHTHDDGADATPRSSMSAHDFEEMRQHLSGAAAVAQSNAATDRQASSGTGYNGASPRPSPAYPPPQQRAAAPTAPDAPATTRSALGTQTATSDAQSGGYLPSEPMSAHHRGKEDKWSAMRDDPGCMCSDSGGCCFSSRGGCCFSDRGGCCFSDREGCCFSDNEGCCFASREVGSSRPHGGGCSSRR